MTEWKTYRKTAHMRAKRIEDVEDLPDDERVGTLKATEHYPEPRFWVRTLEGTMTAPFGSYLARGYQGELYAIDPDIMNDTYEEVVPDE